MQVIELCHLGPYQVQGKALAWRVGPALTRPASRLARWLPRLRRVCISRLWLAGLSLLVPRLWLWLVAWLRLWLIAWLCLGTGPWLVTRLRLRR